MSNPDVSLSIGPDMGVEIAIAYRHAGEEEFDVLATADSGRVDLYRGGAGER